MQCDLYHRAREVSYSLTHYLTTRRHTAAGRRLCRKLEDIVDGREEGIDKYTTLCIPCCVIGILGISPASLSIIRPTWIICRIVESRQKIACVIIIFSYPPNMGKDGNRRRTQVELNISCMCVHTRDFLLSAEPRRGTVRCREGLHYAGMLGVEKRRRSI